MPSKLGLLILLSVVTLSLPSCSNDDDSTDKSEYKFSKFDNFNNITYDNEGHIVSLEETQDDYFAPIINYSFTTNDYGKVTSYTAVTTYEFQESPQTTLTTITRKIVNLEYDTNQRLSKQYLEMHRSEQYINDEFEHVQNLNTLYTENDGLMFEFEYDENGRFIAYTDYHIVFPAQTTIIYNDNEIRQTKIVVDAYFQTQSEQEYIVSSFDDNTPNPFFKFFQETGIFIEEFAIKMLSENMYSNYSRIDHFTYNADVSTIHSGNDLYPSVIIYTAENGPEETFNFNYH